MDVPTLNYGHELWVVTERMRSRIQVAKMSFLCRVAGLSLRDRVRSSDIWERLRVELLLLHIERSQLRWVRHVVKMPPGSMPIWEETPGQPKDTLERLYFLAWEVLVSPWRSWWKWLGRGTSGSPCSSCCPCDPDLDKWWKTKPKQ